MEVLREVANVVTGLFQHEVSILVLMEVLREARGVDVRYCIGTVSILVLMEVLREVTDANLIAALRD